MRRSDFLSGLVCSVAVSALVAPAAADVGGGGSVITTKDATIRVQTVRTQTTNVAVANFLTRLIGRLNTGQVVFDQSYGAAFGSAGVQGALSAARTAITSAGGPGVVILSPVRTMSQSTNAPSSVSSDLTTSTLLQPYTRITFGPDTIRIGDYGICATTGGIVNGLYVPPTGCSLPGTSYDLAIGETNFTTYSVTADDILRTTTITTTTVLNETYELVGVVTPVGAVHGALVREAGLAGERFVTRLIGGPDGFPPVPEGDGEPLFNRVWLGTWGAWGALDGSGDFAPGYDSDVYGVSAGLGTEVADGLTLSAGVDVSWTDTTMALPGGFAERGKAQITQIGLALHQDWGAAEAGLAISYGWGDFDTASGTAALGGVSLASSEVVLRSVEGAFGYRLALGSGTLTPNAGFIWVVVDPGDATGSGSAFDLFVSGEDTTSFQMFAGLDYGERFIVGQGDLTIKLSARVLQELGDETIALQAAFATTPSAALPLALGEAGETAGEVGVALSFAFDDAVSVHAGYDGRFSEGTDIHQAKAGITIRF
ncbi:hypothetical protein sos41_15950 [Alphaproteobacteria bacterium SO-S41]|nr:hypothetical protein sos41_15950 [Alphaproteobacteria bacterium SO-S41]